MKKVLMMLAAIIICGAMLVSCQKEKEKTDDTQLKATDLVGTWEGTYKGNVTIDGTRTSYTLTWTFTLNPDGSSTKGTITATDAITGYESNTNTAHVTDYYIIDNTNRGRVKFISPMGSGIGSSDGMFDFEINLTNKTLTGTFDKTVSGDNDTYTLGGETTLHKK